LLAPHELRCACRRTVTPAARDPYVGFRVVAVDPSADFDWVDVPGGDYPIGRDPEREHDLVDVDASELARTAVTKEQYAGCVAEGGAARPPHWPAPDDHPVTFVDWHDATAFCSWGGGRLSTEAAGETAYSATETHGV